MTDPTIVDALRGSPLATELSDEQARVLADCLEYRDLQPGEVLVKEGTSDDHLYVIVKGALCVVKNPGTAEEATLFTLIARDLVGELGFIDGTVHYASLIAMGPTLVFGLRREKLESLLVENPELVYLVMRAIIRVAHRIQRRLSMQSIELTNYIYKQHGRY
jgi:CRP-like cAMP-binding protein